MMTNFYYSGPEEKRKFLVDDHLDSTEFDFMQNFASDIDEIRSGGANHAEFCLSVVNSSGADLLRGFLPGLIRAV